MISTIHVPEDLTSTNFDRFVDGLLYLSEKATHELIITLTDWKQQCTLTKYTTPYADKRLN